MNNSLKYIKIHFYKDCYNKIVNIANKTRWVCRQNIHKQLLNPNYVALSQSQGSRHPMVLQSVLWCCTEWYLFHWYLWFSCILIEHTSRRNKMKRRISSWPDRHAHNVYILKHKDRFVSTDGWWESSYIPTELLSEHLLYFGTYMFCTKVALWKITVPRKLTPGNC